MDHAHRLCRLGGFLAEHRAFWQPSAFVDPELDWQRTQPALWHYLQSLTDADVASLEADPELLATQLSPWIDGLDSALAWISVPRLDSAQGQTDTSHHDRLSTGVPGRKWQQIRSFAARVPSTPQDIHKAPLLEWCAGKGHLGRWLAAIRDQKVVGLEWDKALCEAGNQLSVQHRMACHLAFQDVLAPEAADWIARSGQVVALHACGELHERLLVLACSQGTPSLSLSPCCYHRRSGDLYRPYSIVGRERDLGLTRRELRLCVQETVTAGRRVRRLRDIEVAWRLGFDALQRELREQDEYLPLPSLPKVLLSGAFDTFCHWAAQCKGLGLSQQLDLSGYEARGWQRLQALRRQELVAHLFRRFIELWVVLDRVCYLQEAGYQVELGTFCDRLLTPRNLMINARLGSGRR